MFPAGPRPADRRYHRGIEVRIAALDLLDQVVAADDVDSGRPPNAGSGDDR
jgi:hypothetical protein